MQNFIAVRFDLSTKSYEELSVDKIDLAALEENQFYWIHCTIDEEQQHLDKLEELLQLPAHISQLLCIQEPHTKIIDTEECVTLLLQTLTDIRQESMEVSPLVIHLTNSVCLTLSHKPIPALENFIVTCARSLKFAKTSCFILFLLMDSILNEYAELILTLDTASEDIDLQVRSRYSADLYEKLLHLRRQMILVKRVIASLRDTLMRISGRKITAISEECRLSLIDIFQHSNILVSEIEILRDLVNSTLEVINNILVHKMTETMQILTAIASIFLPLTFIAGVYGMNFESMPELEWTYGYWYALALMLFCGIALLIYFKRKHWF